MKNIYITPQIKVVSLETNSLLAGSLEVGNEPQNGVSGSAKRRKSDIEWNDFED